MKALKNIVIPVLITASLVESHRGKSYSVTSDTEKIKKLRREFVHSTIQQFLRTMEELGFHEQQIIEAVTLNIM